MSLIIGNLFAFHIDSCGNVYDAVGIGGGMDDSIFRSALFGFLICDIR